jgi:hypothetical protein
MDKVLKVTVVFEDRKRGKLQVGVTVNKMAGMKALREEVGKLSGTCVCVCECVCMYICVNVCVCIYVCMCVCIYVCMRVCIYVCMRV